MRDVGQQPGKALALDDKRSEVEKHIAREHRKLTETDDAELQQEVRDRIRKLESGFPTSSLKDSLGSKPSP